MLDRIDPSTRIANLHGIYRERPRAPRFPSEPPPNFFESSSQRHMRAARRESNNHRRLRQNAIENRQFLRFIVLNHASRFQNRHPMRSPHSLEHIRQEIFFKKELRTNFSN